MSGPVLAMPGMEIVQSPGHGRAGRLLLSAAGAVDRGISLACQGVLLLTGTILMGTLTANVVARYVLATGGFDWAEEVPEQLFPWFIMAGVALAVQRGGHIAVEWLLGKLGRGSRRLLLVAGHVVVAAAYGVVAWQSMVVADIVSIELSPALRLPKTYGYWAIAAGCALLAVSTATVAIRIALLGPEAMPQPKPEEQPV